MSNDQLKYDCLECILNHAPGLQHHSLKERMPMQTASALPEQIDITASI